MACMPEPEKKLSSSQTGGSTMSTRMKDQKEGVIILCLILWIPIAISISVACGVKIVKESLDDQPITFSVELVGAKGIRSALDPGAESPAFKLLVRVDNGHVYGVVYGGGHLLVSYAGVPLARGRIPAFTVGTKKAVAVAVDAGSYGLGIPEDLFRRMSEDRTSGGTGVAQLQVDFWLRYGGFYTCNVDLDTEHHHVSHCGCLNFISSS